MVRDESQPAIMQRENECGRVAVPGRRIDVKDRCTLIVVHEVGQTWAFYPHGWDKLGVRLGKADAVKVAQWILAGAQ